MSVLGFYRWRGCGCTFVRSVFGRHNWHSTCWWFPQRTFLFSSCLSNALRCLHWSHVTAGPYFNSECEHLIGNGINVLRHKNGRGKNKHFFFFFLFRRINSFVKCKLKKRSTAIAHAILEKRKYLRENEKSLSEAWMHFNENSIIPNCLCQMIQQIVLFCIQPFERVYFRWI